MDSVLKNPDGQVLEAIMQHSKDSWRHFDKQQWTSQKKKCNLRIAFDEKQLVALIEHTIKTAQVGESVARGYTTISREAHAAVGTAIAGSSSPF